MRALVHGLSRNTVHSLQLVAAIFQPSKFFQKSTIFSPYPWKFNPPAFSFRNKHTTRHPSYHGVRLPGNCYYDVGKVYVAEAWHSRKDLFKAVTRLKLCNLQPSILSFFLPLPSPLRYLLSTARPQKSRERLKYHVSGRGLCETP